MPVEIEVPVYIDRPMVDEDWLRRFHELEEELGVALADNQTLKAQNHSLRATITQLQGSLELLTLHNSNKNREVEFLLSNKGDYLPTHSPRN